MKLMLFTLVWFLSFSLYGQKPASSGSSTLKKVEVVPLTGPIYFK